MKMPTSDLRLTDRKVHVEEDRRIASVVNKRVMLKPSVLPKMNSERPHRLGEEDCRSSFPVHFVADEGDPEEDPP